MNKEIFNDKILNLDSLYDLDDLQQVKDLINSKPIHPIEYCLSSLENSKYRELFSFAIENKSFLPNGDGLALSIMNGNDKLVREFLISDLYNNSNFSYVNSKFFIKRKILNEKEFVSYMQNIRNDFMLEMVNYFNKKRICAGLDRNYFITLLNKSIDEPELLENLKIKLVKKLEQVLQVNYGCDQEYLQEKIDCFAQNFNINFNGYNIQNLLHKLRISSNDIRHKEIRGDDLTIEELKVCIDYICSIDVDEEFNVNNYDVNYSDDDFDFDWDSDDE